MPRPPHRRHGRRHRGRGAGVRLIEPGVLLLLSEGAAHGYELAEELTEFLEVQRVDVGNLYRLLRRLEEDGLVTSEWNEAESGRAKRVYELTADGGEALEDWAERLGATRDALARFLARFAARQPTPEGNDEEL